MLRTYPLIVALFAVSLTLGPAGCGPTPMEQLDAEVSAMIQRHQRQSLGADAQNDPQPAADRIEGTGITERSYSLTPETTNPGAADLPVRSVPEAERGGEADDLLSAESDPLAGGATLRPVVQLDLPDTLAYAIANSREYRTEKEGLFITALNLLIEKHLWGPRFFNTFTGQVAGTPEGGDQDHVLSLVNEFGVTHRLPYGGTVSASALVNYVNELRRASTSTSTLPRDSQGGALELSIDVPLLRGAGMVAREDLIQAHRNLTYATRDFERFRRSFLVDIATDYFNLLLNRAGIRNREQQLRNLDWLAKRTEALANAGRIAFFEVQRTQQQVLFAENDLVDARDRYETSLDTFKLRLGMPTTTPLQVIPTEIKVPAPVLDPVASVKTALDFRLDLQTDRDQIDDARRGVEVARNALLPGLDAFASTRLPTDPEKRNAGFDLDPGSGAYTAGFTFDAPLDRRIESLTYRRSLISLEQTRRDYSLSRDQVALQVRTAIRSIKQAVATLELQNQNIAASQTRLRGVELRLDTLGPRDFIEAQDDLLEALNRRDLAIRDLRVAVLRFLLDSGQMRVNSRGRWQPPAKLVPPEPQPQMPDARDLINPAPVAERKGLRTRMGG